MTMLMRPALSKQWVVISLLLLAAAGCSQDPKQQRRRELLRVSESRAQPPEKPQPEPLYDDKGNLLPSDEVVLGLRLPRGLKLRRRVGDRWRYETAVPLAKLHWYFGTQLFTADIRRSGGATTYVAARSVTARKAHVRLDVKLGPNPSERDSNFVDIRQRKSSRRDLSAPMLEVRKHLQHEKRFAD